ncbi:MAG TPA: pyrroloquinoline quinone biosynthesis peptide chaperone PqqD [Gemmatimonadaceae bacterium]
MLDGTARPVLWRRARVDFDPVRHRRVLLYPEGTILLNDTAAEILELCDGVRTVNDIADTLGARYATDVRADVVDYLSRLADRELVHDAGA